MKKEVSLEERGYTLMRVYTLCFPVKKEFRIYAQRGNTSKKILVEIQQFSFDRIGGEKVFEKEYSYSQKPGQKDYTEDKDNFGLLSSIKGVIPSVLKDANKNL